MHMEVFWGRWSKQEDRTSGIYDWRYCMNGMGMTLTSPYMRMDVVLIWIWVYGAKGSRVKVLLLVMTFCIYGILMHE